MLLLWYALNLDYHKEEHLGGSCYFHAVSACASDHLRDQMKGVIGLMVRYRPGIVILRMTSEFK